MAQQLPELSELSQQEVFTIQTGHLTRKMIRDRFKDVSKMSIELHPRSSLRGRLQQPRGRHRAGGGRLAEDRPGAVGALPEGGVGAVRLQVGAAPGIQVVTMAAYDYVSLQPGLSLNLISTWSTHLRTDNYGGLITQLPVGEAACCLFSFDHRKVQFSAAERERSRSDHHNSA